MPTNFKRSSAATSSNGINVRGSGGGINFRAATPVTPAFDPLSLPGLSAWYKAEAATVNESLVVTLWVDSSGSDNSLTSIVGSPSLNLADASFNNMPTISFNGSSYLYENNPIGMPQGTAAFSAYVVGSANNTGGLLSMFGWGTNAFASRVNFWAVTSPEPGDYYEMEFSSAAGFAAVTTMGTPVVLSFSIPGGSNFSTGNHYRNNVASTANPYNDATLNITLSQVVAGTLPGAAGLYNLDGKLAEMLVYNAQHTNSERLQVTQYLAGKYGISI